MTYSGQSLRRFEDQRLLTGQSYFVDDIKLAGLLHAAVLWSPHAHGRISSADVSPARRLPGAGGSIGWADPDTHLAVTITHNRMFRATTPEENPFVPIGQAVRKALGVSG